MIAEKVLLASKTILSPYSIYIFNLVFQHIFSIIVNDIYLIVPYFPTGVIMLKLSYGQDSVVSLLSGQYALINLDYVAETPLIEAILNNHTALSGQSLHINETTKAVQLNLSSAMLTDYGTNAILFRLSSQNNTKEISVEVNFEEDISQFEVGIFEIDIDSFVFITNLIFFIKTFITIILG